MNANLPLGCSGHARLVDGSVLLAGGHDGNVGCAPGVANATKFLTGPPGVMYEPGKVLKCGGIEDGPTFGIGSSAVTDLNVSPLTWDYDTPGLMTSARFHHNLVLLADGKILAIGGNDGNPCGDYIYAAELWDPAEPELGWQSMASMVKIRTHHATATLLGDGRVLVAGGDTEYPGPPSECFPGGPLPFSAEIYSPPYLFGPNGAPAVRPQIGFAPTSVGYGQTFNITVSGVPASQIAKVTLLRLGSSTHGFDQDQRFLLLANPPLPVPVSASNISKVAPANANLAPPGTYMLFIISNTGVPSEAWYLRIPSPPPSGI